MKERANNIQKLIEGKFEVSKTDTELYSFVGSVNKILEECEQPTFRTAEVLVYLVKMPEGKDYKLVTSLRVSVNGEKERIIITRAKRNKEDDILQMSSESLSFDQKTNKAKLTKVEGMRKTVYNYSLNKRKFIADDRHETIR